MSRIYVLIYRNPFTYVGMILYLVMAVGSSKGTLRRLLRGVVSNDTKTKSRDIKITMNKNLKYIHFNIHKKRHIWKRKKQSTPLNGYNDVTS